MAGYYGSTVTADTGLGTKKSLGTADPNRLRTPKIMYDMHHKLR